MAAPLERYSVACLGITDKPTCVLKTMPTCANPDGSRIMVDGETGLGIFGFRDLVLPSREVVAVCALDVQDGQLGLRLPAEYGAHFLPLVAPSHPQNVSFFEVFATQANIVLSDHIRATDGSHPQTA